MAREAARLLEGSNWLPEPLRLASNGETVADYATDESVLDGDGAELPAFLADDAELSADEPVVSADDAAEHLQAAE
ncbi:MAG: hypothetical protein IH582_08060 [Afipia sp.]|nr:hypothetical protein [Afipia sp.]